MLSKGKQVLFPAKTDVFLKWYLTVLNILKRLNFAKFG